MSGVARRGEPRRGSSEIGWDVETCSRRPRPGARPACSRRASDAVGGRSRADHRHAALSSCIRRRGGGRRRVCASTERRGSSPAPEAFVRITATTPLVLDVGDRFVVREAGRRRPWPAAPCSTSAPPAQGRAPTPSHGCLARQRIAATTLPALLVRRARRDPCRRRLRPHRLHDGWRRSQSPEWRVADALRTAVRAIRRRIARRLSTPSIRSRSGAALTLARRAVTRRPSRRARCPPIAALADALLTDLADRGVIARDTTTVRLMSHCRSPSRSVRQMSTGCSSPSAASEDDPPDRRRARRGGHRPRRDRRSAAREGVVVRVSSDLVMTTDARRARRVDRDRASGAAGITVSALRESLGTSRKYAVPHHGMVRPARRDAQGRRRSFPARTPARRVLARRHLGGDRDLDAPAERERRHPDRRTSVLARIAAAPRPGDRLRRSPPSGARLKSGVEAMCTVICADPAEPVERTGARRGGAEAPEAARRPPSMPCSTETPSPSNPGCRTCPSMIGTCPATTRQAFRTRPRARTRRQGSESAGSSEVPARRCAAGRPRRSWRASSHERADVRDPVDERSRTPIPVWCFRGLCVTVAGRPARARYVHPVSTLRRVSFPRDRRRRKASTSGPPVRGGGEQVRRASPAASPPLLAPAMRAGGGRRDLGCLVLVMHESGQRAAGGRRSRRLTAPRGVRGHGSISKNRTLAAVTGRSSHAARDAHARLLLDRQPRREAPRSPITFRFWLAVCARRGTTRDGPGRLVAAGWSRHAVERVAGIAILAGCSDARKG